MEREKGGGEMRRKGVVGCFGGWVFWWFGVIRWVLFK